MPAKMTATAKNKPARIVAYRGSESKEVYWPVSTYGHVEKEGYAHLLHVNSYGKVTVYLDQNISGFEPIYEGETITLTVE